VVILGVLKETILSWFMIGHQNFSITLLDDITKAILSSLRQIVPRFGVFEIIPLIAIAILYFISLFILYRSCAEITAAEEFPL